MPNPRVNPPGMLTFGSPAKNKIIPMMTSGVGNEFKRLITAFATSMMMNQKKAPMTIDTRLAGFFSAPTLSPHFFARSMPATSLG